MGGGGSYKLVNKRALCKTTLSDVNPYLYISAESRFRHGFGDATLTDRVIIDETNVIIDNTLF